MILSLVKKAPEDIKSSKNGGSDCQKGEKNNQTAFKANV